MLRIPFRFLEAFKRRHKSFKAREKRIARGKKLYICKFAGGEAEKKRWVFYLIVNVAIDDVLKPALGKHYTMCIEVRQFLISF